MVFTRAFALTIAIFFLLNSLTDAGCHRHKHNRCNECRKCSPQNEEVTTSTTVSIAPPTTSGGCNPNACKSEGYENCLCWKKECYKDGDAWPLPASCPYPDDIPITYANKTCDQVNHGPELVCFSDFKRCQCEPNFPNNNGCLCSMT